MDEKNETMARFTLKVPDKWCPRCKCKVPLVRSREPPHHIHGYKFLCVKCGKYVAWGGKERPVVINGKREMISKWSAKKLGISYCQICRSPLEMVNARGENLDVHHLIPIVEGGKDELSNLLVVCTECHKLIHHRITYGRDHLKKIFQGWKKWRELEDELASSSHEI